MIDAHTSGDEIHLTDDEHHEAHHEEHHAEEHAQEHGDISHDATAEKLRDKHHQGNNIDSIQPAHHQ